MRDDIRNLLHEATDHYHKKTGLFHTINEHIRTQYNLLKAEDTSGIGDLFIEMGHSMNRIDILDYEISSRRDRILHASGMTEKEFLMFCKKSSEPVVREYFSSEQECREAALKTGEALEGLLKAMEGRSLHYLESADEIERIRRLKTLTSST